MMSPENQGVFQLLKEVTFHCPAASDCGSFARHSLAFSGLVRFVWLRGFILKSASSDSRAE
jgi:hypothetical protein